MRTIYIAPRRHLSPYTRSRMREIARKHGGDLHPAAHGMTCIAVDVPSPDLERGIEQAIERDLLDAGI